MEYATDQKKQPPPPPPSGELYELFKKYGTDKGVNEYTEMYEAILSPARDQPLRILEIGIGTLIHDAPSSMRCYCGPGYRPGGSLRAFRDYCPRAEVLGIDVQPGYSVLGRAHRGRTMQFNGRALCRPFLRVPRAAI